MYYFVIDSLEEPGYSWAALRVMFREFFEN
jgi:hypothetical protein